jgi:hypothetical protein
MDGTVFCPEGFDLVEIGGVFIATQGWWTGGTNLCPVKVFICVYLDISFSVIREG